MSKLDKFFNSFKSNSNHNTEKIKNEFNEIRQSTYEVINNNISSNDIKKVYVKNIEENITKIKELLDEIKKYE